MNFRARNTNASLIGGPIVGEELAPEPPAEVLIRRAASGSRAHPTEHVDGRVAEPATGTATILFWVSANLLVVVEGDTSALRRDRAASP
jgi:hypothetical protein